VVHVYGKVAQANIVLVICKYIFVVIISYFAIAIFLLRRG